MTVKELKAILVRLDDEAEVFVEIGDDPCSVSYTEYLQFSGKLSSELIIVGE